MRLLLLTILLVLTPGLLFAADEDLLKGMRYYWQGNYAVAVKHLDAYLENNPDPYAYYVKGYALYKMRRYREAVADFKDAYMVNPGFRLKPAKETPNETQAKETPNETPAKDSPPKDIPPKGASGETPGVAGVN